MGPRQKSKKIPGKNFPWRQIGPETNRTTSLFYLRRVYCCGRKIDFRKYSCCGGKYRFKVKGSRCCIGGKELGFKVYNYELHGYPTAKSCWIDCMVLDLGVGEVNGFSSAVIGLYMAGKITKADFKEILGRAGLWALAVRVLGQVAKCTVKCDDYRCLRGRP